MTPGIIPAVVVAALLSVPSLAEEQHFPRSSAPITVYTNFEETYADPTFESIKCELASIMEPIGLHFEWRSLKTPRNGSEVAAELVVVGFKGKCSMEVMQHAKVPSGALGWTHISDGELLPFSDVDCDRIRQLISPLVSRMELPQRNRILGRAVGRVLAHELYHIFANTTRHATAGVAKGFYSAAELVSDRFRFDEAEFHVLRENKLAPLLKTPSSPAAAGSGQ